MYDGVLEHKEGVLFYSPLFNTRRKNLVSKTKKSSKRSAHVQNERAPKATASKKTSSSV